jgi:hypothetical protein
MKPWQKKMYCIPANENADFVCHMEDVLDVYKLPYNPEYPQICMDETNKQLLKETRKPIAAKPGSVEKYDYAYKRNGVANIFMFCEPLTGWCNVKVTDQRTRTDWAHAIKELVDVHYPNAKKILLVCDNLNTHSGASLYKTFLPNEAKRILNKLEFHYTPKHGSWLNIAELMLSIYSRQCLRRRIPDKPTLRKETTAWYIDRNRKNKKVDWRFTTDDARIKLKRLYPLILS